MPTNRQPDLRAFYLLSLGSFAAKGVFAFSVTYLVANALTTEDYGVWATMFSLAMILGVSELGVGQLILTTFHEGHASEEQAERLVTNCVALMSLLAVTLFLVLTVIFWLTGTFDHVPSVWALIAIVLVRLVVAPHGAYLSAIERFHERKLAEAIAYAVCAVFVLWGVRNSVGLAGLLLGANALLTGGLVALAFRAVALGMPIGNLRSVDWGEVRVILRESVPYFVSNVSTLTTYAGFIALSALVIAPSELGRLSLLHTLVLMHTLQVFELVFRTAQPRMRDPKLRAHLQNAVAIAFVVSVVGAVAFGRRLFNLLFPAYDYSVAELVLYCVFVFLEVYFLLLTSQIQMQSAKKRALQHVSIAKAAGFLAVLGATALLPDPVELAGFTFFLIVYSGAVAGSARRAVLAP